MTFVRVVVIAIMVGSILLSSDPVRDFGLPKVIPFL